MARCLAELDALIRAKALIIASENRRAMHDQELLIERELQPFVAAERRAREL
jgi:hypothetical protein